MDNIEKSKLVIGKTLAFLLERGIQSGSVSFIDIGLEPEYRKFYSATCQWLSAEGIIRFSRAVIGDDGVFSARDMWLTAKGFELLGANIVERQTSIGQALIDATRSSAAETRQAAISSVVGLIISSAARSLTQ